MALGLPSVRPGGAPSVHDTLTDLLAAGGRSFSFEFFPPKDDEGERVLWTSLRRLEPLAPTWVSVTYGAGGSTRDRTVRLVGRIASDTTLTPVAHLTCVGASRAQVRQVVGQYAQAGVRNVLALRGDPPGGLDQQWQPHPDGLRNATELVQMLAGLGRFCVGVAAFPAKHPESPSLDHDADVLVRKASAGAAFAVTQMFFSPDAYFRLRDRVVVRGCDMPVVPGLMPVTNVRQIDRMAAMSGAEFPADLAARLRAVGDDPAAVRAVGVEAATTLAQRLLDGGAPGLHLYTMNRSTATIEVYDRLGLGARWVPSGSPA